MSATPTFFTNGYNNKAQVSAANANRDGTGTTVEIAAGSANGRYIDQILVKAAVATTAGMIRIFNSIDNGATRRLVKEIPVSAVTPSATVEAFSTAWTPEVPIPLPDANTKLYASTEKAEAINLIVFGRAG